MRLIDADAEREDFMEMVYEQLSDDPDNIRANLIIDYYDNLPTVEPVRGEWIYTPTYREYECSNCKSMINLSDDANAHLNFCPQCGADMRKEVE